MAILGGGVPIQGPCTDEESRDAINQLVNQTNDITNVVNQIQIDIGAGAIDNFTFKEEAGGTADFFDPKVANRVAYGPYDALVYQPVYYEIDGSGQIILYTDKGVGAGDNFTVKVAAGGVADFLDAKIHADSWEATDTYNSTLTTTTSFEEHGIVQAANVGDTVRFYFPLNIIKTSVSDSTPNFLFAKYEDTSVAYDADDHTICYVNDLGSKLRVFFDNQEIVDLVVAEITAILQAQVTGTPRVGIVYSDVNAATGIVGGQQTPGSGIVTEYLYNPLTSKYEPDTTVTCYTWMRAVTKANKPVVFMTDKANRNWIISEGCALVGAT